MNRIVVDTGNKKELASYLACDAKAVDLPPIHREDTSYPVTILDGASGVGKTQQAFALMRAGYSVSYINLCQVQLNSQLIYRAMKEIAAEAEQRSYLSLIHDSMAATQKETAGNIHDWCSVRNLERLKNKSFIKKLAKCFDALAMAVSLGMGVRLFGGVPVLHRNAKSNAGEWNVLFVDEALPKHQTSSRFSTYDTLRFVKNLGRILRWRVVVAGTAATAATMTADTSPQVRQVGSRLGIDTVAWAHVIFIYSETASNFFKIRSGSRPLVSQLIDSVMGMHDGASKPKPWTALQKLANTLRKRKPSVALDDNKLVWLSGAWLDQSIEKPVSPFALRSSDLVAGHFFEPSISLVKDTNEPYLGHGVADTYRKSGPLSVALLKRDHFGQGKKPVDWCVLTNFSNEPTHAYISNSRSRVTYFLSHCIQQCLAKEPFLAVILSLISHLTREEFQSSISTFWQESAVQRSVGNLDGELFEYSAFAALQLACRDTNASFKLGQPGSTGTVFTCLEKLFAYLAVGTSYPREASGFDEDLKEHNVRLRQRVGEPVSSMKFVIESYKKKSSTGKVENSKNKRPGGVDIDKEPDDEYRKRVDQLLDEGMPWLVPCCMAPRKCAKAAGIEELSKLLNIAALVPGENNASLDAVAYPKKGMTRWYFAFKGRTTNEYTVTDGFWDLDKKCGNRECHALLVASTAHQQSDCNVWLENNYLRVVMRIGNHHKLVDQRQETTEFRLHRYAGPVAQLGTLNLRD